MNRVITYPLTHNSINHIIEELSNAISLNREGAYMVVLPTRQLFHHIRNRLLKGDIKGYGELHLLTFNDVVRNILLAAGVKRRLMDDTSKALLMARILRRENLRKELQYFVPIVDFQGFQKAMLRTIGQLKRSLITPETLLETLGAEGIFIRDKHADTYRIYSRYQEELAKYDLMDNEEAYYLAKEAMVSRPHIFQETFKVDKVLMAEFYEFNPLQLEILKGISKHVDDMDIYLPFEEGKKTYQQIALTLGELQKLGFLPFEKSGTFQSRPEGLEHLQSKLFVPGADRTPYGEGISIFKAPDREREVRESARTIKKLILKEGYKPHDICLIVRDLYLYQGIIMEEFNRMGIPCTLPWSEPLLGHSLISAIISMASIQIEGWSRNSLLKAIKCQYVSEAFGIDGDLLELLVAPYVISSKDSWLELIDMHLTSDRVGQIQALKDGFLHLISAIELLPLSSTPGRYIRVIRELLTLLNAYGRVLDPCGPMVMLGLDAWNLELCRDLEALTGIEKSLSILEEAFAASNVDDEMSLEEFLETWLACMEGMSITLRKGDPGGVQVMGVSSARGLEFPVVFLCGLADGIFPKHEKESWVWADGEMDIIEGRGLNMSHGRISSDMEELLFAVGVTRALQRIYISYPVKDQNDEDILPSPFFLEVQNLFEPGAISFSRVESSQWLPEDYEDAAHYRELLQMAVIKANNKEVLHHLLTDIGISGGRIDNLCARIGAQDERFSTWYGPFDGYISESRICQRLSKRFGLGTVFSAGLFRDYAFCPLHFFFSRVLCLTPWEEAEEGVELDARDKGDIYHKVLALFLSQHSHQPLNSLRYYEYLAQMEDILNAVYQEYGTQYRSIHPKLRDMDKDRSFQTLDNWLLAELKDLDDSTLKWRPVQLEWSFGMAREEYRGILNHASTKKPLRLYRDGEEILIRGKVDRIDLLDDGSYAICDYKTSTGVPFKDISDGLELQIPIYIKAVQELFCKDGQEVVGGGYYSLRQLKRGQGIWKKEATVELSFLRYKRSGKLDEEEWGSFFVALEDMLFSIRKNILKGDFALRPRKCMSYCPFKYICRYDRMRIARKESALLEERA